MRTPKQNYLGMAKGEKPDDLVFLGGYNPLIYGEGNLVQYVLYGPEPFVSYDFGGKDVWVVNWIAEESGGAQPEYGVHVLTDETKWREQIHPADLSHVDWKRQAEKDLKMNYEYGVDIEKTVMRYWLHCGYVTELTNLMGFSEALMAMFESPEDIYDLFSYMCDYYCDILEKTLPLYKPDTYHMFDTYAGSANAFYSVDMYKKLVLPFHQREADIAHRFQLPIEMHCAGKSADFIDAMEPLGISYWIGAEDVNDIMQVMKKHPGLVMSGAWRQTDQILRKDCSEEVFKQSVKDVIDKYAPTGRFAWFDCVLAGADNKEDADKKNAWLREVLYTYGKESMR